MRNIHFKFFFRNEFILFVEMCGADYKFAPAKSYFTPFYIPLLMEQPRIPDRWCVHQGGTHGWGRC